MSTMNEAKTIYESLSEADRARCEAASERYEALGHAIQSGIAMAMNHEPNLSEPKHLRVGIDLSKSDQLGLASLLVEKGLITWPEYMEAMADAAQTEKERWEERLADFFGREVTLI